MDLDGRRSTRRRPAADDRSDQVDLADLAGVGLSSVRALEAGQSTVTLEITLRVLDALGLAAAVGPQPALRAVAEAVVLVPSSGESR